MDYIEISLPMTALSPGQDLYPERAMHDIVKAKYHNQHLEKENPDIAALPPRVTDTKLVERCAKGFPGYNREVVSQMKLSERLIALDALKDHVRVYLPYYVHFYRRFLTCLQSAYHGRKFAIGKHFIREKKESELDRYTLTEIGEDQILSAYPKISRNVQCLSLVGVAGSGKSTCLQYIMSFFPNGLRHDLPGGYKYVEIPFLQMSAVDVPDTKAFFIALAGQIDSYVGHGNIYESLMRRQNNIPKMLEYFAELSTQFHVGMIIFDEVQMITDKGIFRRLLSLSNLAHVSICLVGTEEAMSFIHKNSWAMRRFGGPAMIKADCNIQEQETKADSDIQEQETMRSTLRQLWRYQFTYAYTKEDVPDEETVKLFVDASMGNVDLLFTLFIKAQRIALMDKTKSSSLTPDIVRKAVRSLQEAKRLLKSERDVIKAYLPQEKEELQAQLRKDIATERAKEAKALQEAAEKEFRTRTNVLDDLVFRIGNVADYSFHTIESAYDRLVDSGIDLISLEPRQRAKVVLSALQEEEMQKQQKKEKTVGEKAKKSKHASIDLKPELDDVLSGGIDDIANIQTTAS